MTTTENTTGERAREYRWEDPRVLAAAVPTVDGLSFMRAMQSGELPRPPIVDTICECRCGAPGRRTARLRAGDLVVTQTPSGRFGVPWIRRVRRGCRRRPGPPAGLIEACPPERRDSSQICRLVIPSRPAPPVTALHGRNNGPCRCWQTASTL